ncbi:hypothetical protein ACNI65_17460 [Roseateles sp. So40a]|uniref:hypothetical protein n=1 Tax=Roseateles sp. So40a TaxID=3400226 RepID=UPI003A86D20E
MTSLVARAGHGPFTPPPEDPIRNRLSGTQGAERGPWRAPTQDRAVEAAHAEAQRIAERRAARAEARQDFLQASANSAGLGESAEEITFGTSEREEIEAHDDARDAQSAKVEQARAMMRIDAIQTMLRQLAGDHQFASIRQRAERFASLWAQGRDAEATASLDVDTFRSDEREALMTLALKHLAPGARAEELKARLQEDQGEATDAVTVQAWMRAAASTGRGAASGDAMAPGSPLYSLLQSPPTPKLVLDAKAAMGERGLDRLAAMAVPRGRVDPRRSRGTEVFLSLSLLRAIQQVRVVETQAQRLLKAGPCPGAGKPEDAHKCAEWLIATTFAMSPQATLARMPTVLRVNGDALASARRHLQRALPELPSGIWLNGDTKQLVRQELSFACAHDLESRGLLNRQGMVRRAG